MTFGVVTVRVQAVVIIVTAIALAGLGWFAMDKLQDARDNADHAEQLPDLAVTLILHPATFVLLALPGLIVGVAALLAPRGRIVLVALGWLLQLLPVMLLIYTLFAFLAPLYTYQEL